MMYPRLSRWFWTTAFSTLLVVHLRAEEVRGRVSPAFVLGLIAFNLALYGLLVEPIR